MKIKLKIGTLLEEKNTKDQWQRKINKLLIYLSI